MSQESTSRTSLLEAAKAFCSAFACQNPPADILSQHFTSNPSNIMVLEHGLPQLAPFLGRTFKGKDGFLKYMETISSCLSFENMRFSNYVVDAESRKVSVRGEAKFTWTSTKQSWDEVFTYVLEFDNESRVQKYEIWADSGAAYLASQGKLDTL